MNIEKLLSELKSLDPYQQMALRQALDDYNERKMIETVGKLFLGLVGLIFWFLAK